MRSIGQVLDENKGIGPGFDTLRISLSLAVMFIHAAGGVDGDHDLQANYLFQMLHATILPVFFALSGFLVMGSAHRNKSLWYFLRLRGLRILPALSTEVILAGFLLGSLVTKLPFREYFSDSITWTYVLNIVGWVHFKLPGVFAGGPVNVSLWSIQPEIICYLFLAVLFVGRWHLDPRVIGAVFLGLLGLNAALDATPQAPSFESIGPLAQARLFLYFVAGALVYHLRYRLPAGVGVVAVVFAAAVILMPLPGWRNISVLPMAYSIAVLGVWRLPTPNLVSSGDYSYGIYLYGFPFQQVQRELMPDMREWYWNLAFAVPVACLMAAFSWHCIEKPALRLRGTPPKIEDGRQGLLSHVGARFGVLVFLFSYFFLLTIWSGFFPVLGFSIRSNLGVIVVATVMVAAGLAWFSQAQDRVIA